MTSPGGANVGRVSVKVVPDTSKFAAELKAKLAKVDDEFEVDVNLDTDRALAQFQKLKQRLENDDINVNIDYNTTGARQFGRSGSMLQRVGRSLGAPMRAFGGFFSFVGKGLSNLAENMTGFASTAVSGMGKFTSGLGKGISAMSSAVGMGAALLLIGGLLAGAFAGIAGAVMFLGGLLTAVLGSIPVLIAAIAAPIAALIIGFDGVSAAAKTLQPQLESLKHTLTSTFQDGFTPIFEKLKAVFPALEAGLQLIAERTIEFADALADMVSTEEGIRKVEAAFRGIDQFMRMLAPGAQQLLQSFLDIAATESLFTTLGTSLGTVLGYLGGFFDKIRESGQLEDGLRNLGAVLISITGLFTTLLEGALDFFNGAAPGMVEFFNGLESFFSKFDWTALGESFGGIFAAIGDFFAGLDQATVDKFVQSFIAMGDQVTKFIESGGLELLITLLFSLNYVFAFLMASLNGFVAGFFGLMAAVDWVVAGLSAAWESIKSAAASARDKLNEIMEQIVSWAERKWDELVEGVRTMGRNMLEDLRDAWDRAGNAVKSGVDRAVRFVRELPGKAKDAVSNVGNLLVAAGKSLIDGFISGIRSKISAVASAVKSAVSAARAYFPFSPAKVGPFSGRGYTSYSGRALIEDWAKGIEDAAPEALKAVSSLMDAANNTASAEWNAHVSSDGFGGVRTAVFDGVMDAFSGSRLHVDGNGMAKIVNNVNARNARR